MKKKRKQPKPKKRYYEFSKSTGFEFALSPIKWISRKELEEMYPLIENNA